MPKCINLTPKQLDELLARAKEFLQKEDYEIIKGMSLLPKGHISFIIYSLLHICFNIWQPGILSVL